MTTSDSIEKETTFTPGPWVPHLNTGSPPFVTRLNDNSGWICQTVTWCGLEEAKANALLIAAATELYAVVADFMENPNFRVAVGGNPNAVDELMARARNALAKARGEDRSHEGK